MLHPLLQGAPPFLGHAIKVPWTRTLLREEVRVKDARMARIDPRQRPFYPPTEHLAILELKAARGWSLERIAKAFLVTAATIASWMKRLDEDGPYAA